MAAFPRCAGQLVAKAKRRAAAEVYIYAGTGKTEGAAAGRRGPYYNAHASVLSAGKMADCTHGRTMEGVLDLCNGTVSEKTPQIF